MSKLINSPITPREATKREQAADSTRKAVIKGSKRLAKAILSTNKLFGPMSIASQIEAIEYAYDIQAVIRFGKQRAD